MDQVARRVVIVVGLLLLVPAVIIALLPVSISFLNLSVGCNPATIAKADNAQTVGGASYVPAIVVWTHPSSVVPAGIPETDGQQVSVLCGSAAQDQMIPALVLGGLGVFLLLFGGIIVRYVRTGDASRRAAYAPAYGPAAQSKPFGWYPSPEDNSILRWWDGQRWTADTLNRQQAPGTPQGASGQPAGWYPSPEDSGILRWWDGQRWTAETLNRQS